MTITSLPWNIDTSISKNDMFLADIIHRGISIINMFSEDFWKKGERAVMPGVLCFLMNPGWDIEKALADAKRNLATV